MKEDLSLEDDLLLDPEIEVPADDKGNKETDDELHPDDAKYLQDLAKDKPSVLNRLGIYTQADIDKERKTANDNRRELRVFGERANKDIADLRSQIEALKSQKSQGDSGDEETAVAALWEKAYTTGSVEDIRKAQKAETALDHKRMRAELDATLATERRKMSQTQSQAQAEREIRAVLAREENKDLSLEAIDEFFRDNAPPPEIDVLVYRIMNHPGGLDGYMNDMVRARIRNPGGARTAPVTSSGGQRPSPNRGMTREEMLKDFRGQE